MASNTNYMSILHTKKVTTVVKHKKKVTKVTKVTKVVKHTKFDNKKVVFTENHKHTEAILQCHRCNKLCKSKSGLTKHYKACIGSISKKTIKKELKKTPEEKEFKTLLVFLVSQGRVSWSMRPGVYLGNIYTDEKLTRFRKYWDEKY